MVAVPKIGKILYRPVRCMIRPTISEVPISPTMNAVRSSPAMVGVFCFTICRYRGMRTSPPNITMPTKNATTLVTEKTGLRKIRSGKIASSPILFSRGRKATNDRTDTATMPRVSTELQPHSRPFSATSSSGTTVEVSRPAPR